MPFTKEDSVHIFELRLTGSELDYLLAALDHWREDYPDVQSVFNKVEDAAGCKWEREQP